MSVSLLLSTSRTLITSCVVALFVCVSVCLCIFTSPRHARRCERAPINGAGRLRLTRAAPSGVVVNRVTFFQQPIRCRINHLPRHISSCTISIHAYNSPCFIIPAQEWNFGPSYRNIESWSENGDRTEDSLQLFARNFRPKDGGGEKEENKRWGLGLSANCLFNIRRQLWTRSVRCHV